MTEAQANMLLVQHRAHYVTTKNSVEWWRLPSGEWLGKRALGNGYYEVRRFSAGSCGC